MLTLGLGDKTNNASSCALRFAACHLPGSGGVMLTHKQWTAAKSRAHSGDNERDFRIHFTGVNEDNAHYPYMQQKEDGIIDLYNLKVLPFRPFLVNILNPAYKGLIGPTSRNSHHQAHY